MSATPLERLLELVAGASGARINFWDLAGITRLSRDLALDFEKYQIHTSPVCVLAKSTTRGWRRCIRCKAAAGHKAATEGAFTGRCHLGLVEAIHPVRLDGRLIGILFAGQVRTRGAGKPARRSLRVRAARLGVSPAALAAAERAVPAVRPDELEALRGRLDLVDRYIVAQVKASGRRPASREPLRDPVVPEVGVVRGRDRRRRIARAAIELIRREYHKPLRTAAVARRLGVGPAVFCRAFREEAGFAFRQYLRQVRLEAATNLLGDRRASVTWAALESGFRDPAYFSRVFRREHGVSPRWWRAREHPAPRAPVQSIQS